jgi:hypothetical protein
MVSRQPFTLRSTAETADVLILPADINSPPGPINLILALYLEYNKKLGIWISTGAAGWKPGPQGRAGSADPGLRGWGGGRLQQYGFTINLGRQAACAGSPGPVERGGRASRAGRRAGLEAFRGGGSVLRSPGKGLSGLEGTLGGIFPGPGAMPGARPGGS